MEFTGFPFLTAILLSCVAGLLVILILPEQRKAQIKWVSAVFSGITLILSLYLFIAYDKGQGGLQFVEKFSWVESIGISYLNAADGFNLPMLLLTGIVFFTGVLTMWELDYRVKEFFALYFLLVAGVFGLFMSMDLFFIFVWYDVSLHTQRIRCHEVDALPAGGQRLDSAGDRLPVCASRFKHI